MFRDRKELTVFEEENLEEILGKIGLLEKFKDNKLNCYICNGVINANNFGAFVKKNENILVVCKKTDCLGKIYKELENDS